MLQRTIQLQTRIQGQPSVDGGNNYPSEISDDAIDDCEGENDSSSTNYASKRQMLKFAGPALGIYLSSPLLSNIDNAFVGRSVGTNGLAALSPGTILTDQLMYLFSCLSRATTGIVSKAYGSKDSSTQSATGSNVEAAREAASAPLTVSLICGLAMTAMYAFFTPKLLSTFNVSPSLRSEAGNYIRWRGVAVWAALAQNCCLSVLMSTRDAMTPLKIVAFASAFNIVGDWLLCVFPLRWGCGGAAAATSAATLCSSALMVNALRKKRLLPSIRVPSVSQLKDLCSYALPLFAITLTRLGGFFAMQKAASKLGIQSLAAYQLCFNIMVFFLLFGEPLSQLSQTRLPSLIEARDGNGVSANLKSALGLAGYTSLAVGAVAFAMVRWGSSLFLSDAAVQQIAKETAPSILAAVTTAIFTVAVDGSMLASRDFGFMLGFGLSTFLLQLVLLRSYCTSVSFIFATFTVRLGSYALMALARSFAGFGTLGKVMKSKNSST